MWQSQIETIQSNRILKYRLKCDRHKLTYLEVIELWQSDRDFNVFFNSLLARCPFAAYFWETPPIKLSTVNQEFEFVSGVHWLHVRLDSYPKYYNYQPYK